jgi:hypothetical protein
MFSLSTASDIVSLPLADHFPSLLKKAHYYMRLWPHSDQPRLDSEVEVDFAGYELLKLAQLPSKQFDSVAIDALTEG